MIGVKAVGSMGAADEASRYLDRTVEFRRKVNARVFHIGIPTLLDELAGVPQSWTEGKMD